MATTSVNITEDDGMRPEYDFRGAIRGKHYKPLHKGYSVHVQQTDGTTIIQNYKLEAGTVMLEPDVRSYFPDSDAVNAALRSLIELLAQLPSKPKSGARTSRPAAIKSSEAPG